MNTNSRPLKELSDLVLTIQASIVSSTIGENKVRRFKEIGLEQVRLNDQLVDLIQDICRVKIRHNDNLSPIKVYIPTKDRVLINPVDCEERQWVVEETYPEWYSALESTLLDLADGEKITKKTLREKLGLLDEAGKKYFQRMQQKELFVDLLKKTNVSDFNKQSFIRRLVV